MRRASILIVLSLLIAGAVLLVVAQPQLLLKIGLGGDTGKLTAVALSFLEDLQFKDFEGAARYHSPEDQEEVDIPFLIERLFRVKPEMLDIMQYEVIFVKVDSTGLRARVKTITKVRLLNYKTEADRELMLYFYRESKDHPWYMNLERSLRSAEKDKNKKHS